MWLQSAQQWFCEPAVSVSLLLSLQCSSCARHLQTLWSEPPTSLVWTLHVDFRIPVCQHSSCSLLAKFWTVSTVNSSQKTFLQVVFDTGSRVVSFTQHSCKTPYALLSTYLLSMQRELLDKPQQSYWNYSFTVSEVYKFLTHVTQSLGSGTVTNCSTG